MQLPNFLRRIKSRLAVVPNLFMLTCTFIYAAAASTFISTPAYVLGEVFSLFAPANSKQYIRDGFNTAAQYIVSPIGSIFTGYFNYVFPVPAQRPWYVQSVFNFLGNLMGVAATPALPVPAPVLVQNDHGLEEDEPAAPNNNNQAPAAPQIIPGGLGIIEEESDEEEEAEAAPQQHAVVVPPPIQPQPFQFVMLNKVRLEQMLQTAIENNAFVNIWNNAADIIRNKESLKFYTRNFWQGVTDEQLENVAAAMPNFVCASTQKLMCIPMFLGQPDTPSYYQLDLFAALRLLTAANPAQHPVTGEVITRDDFSFDLAKYVEITDMRDTLRAANAQDVNPLDDAIDMLLESEIADLSVLFGAIEDMAGIPQHAYKLLNWQHPAFVQAWADSKYVQAANAATKHGLTEDQEEMLLAAHPEFKCTNKPGLMTLPVLMKCVINANYDAPENAIVREENGQLFAFLPFDLFELLERVRDNQDTYEPATGYKLVTLDQIRFDTATYNAITDAVAAKKDTARAAAVSTDVARLLRQKDFANMLALVKTEFNTLNVIAWHAIGMALQKIKENKDDLWPADAAVGDDFKKVLEGKHPALTCKLSGQFLRCPVRIGNDEANTYELLGLLQALKDNNGMLNGTPVRIQDIHFAPEAVTAAIAPVIESRNIRREFTVYTREQRAAHLGNGRV